MPGRFDLDAFDPAVERGRLMAQPGCGFFQNLSDAAVLAHVILGEDLGLRVNRVLHSGACVEIETESVDYQRADQIRAMLDYVIVHRGRELHFAAQSTVGEEVPDFGGPRIHHGLCLRWE